MSNCLIFPPAESLNGKLLAAEPGVKDDDVIEVDKIVWVSGMSRGAGDGFIDGVGACGAEVGARRDDEERSFGEELRAIAEALGEPGGSEPSPLSSPEFGMLRDGALFRTASYSWAALCV
jgi:hypothetical protein